MLFLLLLLEELELEELELEELAIEELEELELEELELELEDDGERRPMCCKANIDKCEQCESKTNSCGRLLVSNRR